MEAINTLKNKELYILNHQKCGKCNNVYYVGEKNHPFSCYDGTLLPRYVILDFMSNCPNFSKRTKTSLILTSDTDKEFELFCKVLK